ncbi:MAG: hypothetical protein IT381_23225 [Deltaproteobacteria bacterium]|nr:hypothetical protein [Deltaproteobacteria bacterium]
MQQCLLLLTPMLFGAAAPIADPEPLIVDSAHQKAMRGEIDDAVPTSPTPASPPSPARSEPNRVHTGVVYGYFPAGYTLTQIKGWDELTHIVWFGPTINSSGSMGSTAGLGGATYKALREETRARGIALVIGLINFNTEANPSSVATLLANKTTAVATMKKLVTDYDADGVSLDFEVVPEASKQAYVDFLRATSDALHAIHPDYSVSSAIPPPTGWKGYDYVGILQNSDLAFVMAYDYYWKGAPTAGPVTPKNDGTKWGPTNLTTSLAKLDVAVGDLKAKLVIGLPWYGYSWPTSSTSVPSSTVARPEAPTYAPTCASGKSRIASGSYDTASEQPYAAYYDAYGARQMWLDDVASFAKKMDLVKSHDFGGVGMFQIGYEGDDPAFWTAISERYTTIDAPPVAKIVAPSTIVVGEPASLDATGSSDPEGDALTFAWTSSGGALVNVMASKATLTASAPGKITVHLAVSDARQTSAPVDHEITVVAAAGKVSGGGAPTGAEPSGTSSTQAQPNEDLGRQSINARHGTIRGGCNGAGASTFAWLFVALVLALRGRRGPRRSPAGGRDRTATSAALHR